MERHGTSISEWLTVGSQQQIHICAIMGNKKQDTKEHIHRSLAAAI
jgi:hypothetical protein